MISPDEAGEVAAHPRHAAELRAMGDLVDGDPEPEVAWPEREPLLEPQDVRTDVVHGVDVGRRGAVRSTVLRDQQVVLAEDSLRQASRGSRPSGSPTPSDPPTRSGPARRDPPIRVVKRLQPSAHGRDVGVDPPGAVEHGGTGRAVDPQARELADEGFRFDGGRRESAARDAARYESASGSRPPKRRAMRAASAQSTGSGVVSVAGVAVAVTRPAGPAAWG